MCWSVNADVRESRGPVVNLPEDKAAAFDVRNCFHLYAAWSRRVGEACPRSVTGEDEPEERVGIRSGGIGKQSNERTNERMNNV